MKAIVTNAEKVGGWVTFTFRHHVCASGCDLTITPTTFTNFVKWLKTRPATTTVKTVDDVIGGAVAVHRLGSAGSSGTTLKNPSLETATAPFPQCWTPAGGAPTRSRRRGAPTRTAAASRRRSTSPDTHRVTPNSRRRSTWADCSPNVIAGKTYTIGAWYKSTGMTQFALYYRNTSGAWSYWTSSPYFATASNWTHATWTTPPVPAGATGMSFGLTLIANGYLTTDDYSLAAQAQAQARGGGFSATPTILLTAIATLIAAAGIARFRAAT